MAKVIVSFNSPFGQIFKIPGNDGKEKRVKINGNASHLVGVTGAVLPVGRFGQTEIAAEEWEAIVALYGKMKIFKRGLIFANESVTDAGAQEIDQAETRHGAEPVDVNETETEPNPNPLDTNAKKTTKKSTKK